MMEASDKPAADIARELGLRRNQLYKWKEQLEKIGDVAPGKRGRPKKQSKVKQQNWKLRYVA